MRSSLIEYDFCNKAIPDGENYLSFDASDIFRDDPHFSTSEENDSEFFACMACKSKYENFMQDFKLWNSKNKAA
ncbi:MAG: hypothetical protein HF978_06675 [Desulfobacteraceae bacterium]|nr:hypothetical protein [Desulfobacteraceae bacterium]MBC2755216.1 hypothetical protein [Desulfobacteraceae bacterium]